MIAYFTLIVTSILVGLAAVLVYRNKNTLEPRVFLTAACLNLGAVLAFVLLRNWRRKWQDD